MLSSYNTVIRPFSFWISENVFGSFYVQRFRFNNLVWIDVTYKYDFQRLITECVCLTLFILEELLFVYFVIRVKFKDEV